MLIGNAGANKLDGKGGDDTAAGAAGNNMSTRWTARGSGDRDAGEGMDRCSSVEIHFTLGAFVENLTLTATPQRLGIGNALANKITGNAGKIPLRSSPQRHVIGNDGDDSSTGGIRRRQHGRRNGVDTYLVDDRRQDPGEWPDGEFDEVKATITFTLGRHPRSAHPRRRS